MSKLLDHVAIIGAGLAGCALALAFSAEKIPLTVYESRPADSDVLASGVILTPNGLRVLDRLSVFERIKDRCWKSTYRCFKNDNDETVRKVNVADESVYGFTNHRIWRKLLLDEMKIMLKEREVTIKYDSKFGGIMSDDTDSVKFLINGSEQLASLLIGSDGIFSTVRKHLDADVVPEYTGTVVVLSHIKRASVTWPYDDYERNATIQGKAGAIFFLPEDPETVDIMIGRQVQHPQQSRENLERLQADKDKLVDFYRKDYDQWGGTAQSIIDSVCANKETSYIWPYMRMPKLRQWYSDTGRVIIVGDGAHALPPSSGQGVNQALEDVFSLTQLLSGVSEANAELRLLDALAFWQDMRQQRIDAVFEYATNATNVQRMPEADRKKLIAEGKANESDDMQWLYKPDLEGNVAAWLSANRG